MRDNFIDLDWSEFQNYSNIMRCVFIARGVNRTNIRNFSKRTQNNVSTRNSRKEIVCLTDTSIHRLSKLDEKTKIKIVFLFLFCKNSQVLKIHFACDYRSLIKNKNGSQQIGLISTWNWDEKKKYNICIFRIQFGLAYLWHSDLFNRNIE